MSEHQGGATDEEWAAALREYRTQKRKVDEDNGLLRSIVKRWKAAGVPIPSLLATAKAARRDPDEVIAEFANTVRFMGIARIPITRESLFPEFSEPILSDRAQYEADMWDAEDRGYRAGRTGVPLDDCPFDAGTEAAEIWTRFWHTGQAAIARELGDNAQQADGSRRHPTRDTATTVEEVEQSMGGAARRKRGRPRKEASEKAPRTRRRRADSELFGGTENGAAVQ